LRDERKFALVLVPNLTRFCFCFADHLCEFAQARTIDPREIAVLGALSGNTGPCCNQRVEICGRVSTIPFDGFGRPRQLKPFGIVRDQTKLLLRYVAIGPGLAFLRQKCDAYQRRQLNVVLGHLLQWRVRVGEPKRARAAALVFISGIAAVRIYFGVDATVHDVVDDLRLEKVFGVPMQTGGLGDQRREPVRRLSHPFVIAGLERRVAFLCERVLDFQSIECRS